MNTKEPIISFRDVHKNFGHGARPARGRFERLSRRGGGGHWPQRLGQIHHAALHQSPGKVDHGRIVVDGIPLDQAKNINQVRTEVGMVFQLFNLFPHLTVLDNIDAGAEGGA